MEKIRVEVFHFVTEHIILDVEVPDRETFEKLRPEVYAMACELPGWEVDTASGAASANRMIVETAPAQSFDVPPHSVLRINSEGHLEALADETRDPEKEARNKTLAAKIGKVLMENQSCCLDTPDERTRVLNALVERLS